MEEPYTSGMGLLEEAILTGTISALSMVLFLYWTARALALSAPQGELDKILNSDFDVARRVWLALRVISGAPALLSA